MKKKCYLCDNSSYEVVGQSIKKGIDVRRCNSCGLEYLRSFDHISSDYYLLSGMRDNEKNPNADNLNCENFMEWRKVTQQDDFRRYSSLVGDIENNTILDFGCGNGGFLSYAKEKAHRTIGVELDENSREHMKMDHLEVYPNISYIPPDVKFDLIVSFHVFEHLKDPALVLKKLSSLIKPEGKIILEMPNSDDALKTIYNCEEFSQFTYRDDHLMLFNTSNISLLVEKSGMKVSRVFQFQRYPLSNHLYWLSAGKPNGHAVWDFLISETANKEYEKCLSSAGRCDTVLVEAKK